MSIVLTRATKQAARYTDAGGRERCSGCRFFLPQGTCGRIVGPVSPRGWCRFFSQEAVQRWQPQGAIGFGMGPSLALDFMNPGTLPTGFVLTRTSTATYFDATGTMQTAAINAPRWDYSGGVLRGLLIEETRINLALSSGNFANASWPNSGIIVAAPVVTGNQIAAPDGTLTGARVVYPAVNGAGADSHVSQSITATAAPYTFSFFLRGAVGGEQLYISVTPDAVTYYRQPVTLTTSWQRFTLTTPALTAVPWFLLLGTDLRDAGQTSKPAQTIYAWGGQAELGGFATSYIPTTATTATRSPDLCSLSVGAWFNPAATSVVSEAITLGVGSSGYGMLHAISDVATNNRLQQAIAVTTRFAVSVVTSGGTNSVVIPETAAVTYGTPFKFGGTLGPGAFQSSLNGATPYSQTAGVVMPVSPTSLYIGNIANGFVHNGYIRNVRYWPRVLSAAELQSVTT